MGGKLTIDGDADEIQLLVQGNGTQTSNLVVFENSPGTDQLSLTNGGNLTIAGDLAISGGNITTAVTADSTFTVTGSFNANSTSAFSPDSTNDITFNVDSDSLVTLDSSVANGDNLVLSPNNTGTGSTFTGTLTTANLTGDQTYTLKDASGTIAFTSDIPVSDNYQYWTVSDGRVKAISSLCRWKR